MATYATVTDYTDYSAVAASAGDVEAALARAERDVDRLLSYTTDPLREPRPALRVDPTTDAVLEAADLAALRDATCAQAEYRLTMGEGFFIRAQLQKVQGPDFTQEGTLPRIGPKVHEELARSPLLRGGMTSGISYGNAVT